MSNIITITREFGSLGRPIAKQLAKISNLSYYDRDIVEKTAESMGVKVNELEEFDGVNRGSYWRMGFPLGLGSHAKQDNLFNTERQIILDFADKSDCIIVGRCSDYILKTASDHNVFSVHIYAPYSARFNFCSDELNLTQDTIIKTIDQVDAARESFYKYHTGEKFDSLKYRDLLINSASFNSFDDIAEIIWESAKKKFNHN